MRPLYAFTLASLIAAAANPALAEDSRIVTRRYDPGIVIPVSGKLGIQATIAFAEDERIENVAVGDSAMWQVTPNKRANLLFVKPIARRAHTNMTVVTDQRTYLFDLVAGASPAPVYVMRFSYPAKPKPPEPVVVAVAEPVAPPPPSPTSLNFGWKTRGSRGLVPARMFDDGRALYLEWAAGASVPAMLIRDEKGTEGPVNYSVQGEYVVVEGVPGELVLRSGKEVATLTRDAKAPVQTAANLSPLASAR